MQSSSQDVIGLSAVGGSEAELGAPRLTLTLMRIIVDHLADDEDQASLASLQSTSSEMYNIVTPHLYRCLKLTSVKQAVDLLGLFNEISLSDRRQFCQTWHNDTNTHPIDLPFHLRLRWFLSHTTHLSFEIKGFRYLQEADRQQALRAYHDVHAAMLFMQTTPRLWSSLRELRIDYSAKCLDLDARSLAEPENILDAQRLAELHRLLFSSDLAPRDLLVYVSPTTRFHESFQPLYHGACLRQYELPSAPRIVIENHTVVTHNGIPDNCTQLEICLARDPSWSWPDRLAWGSNWGDSIGIAAEMRTWLSDTEPAVVPFLKISDIWGGKEGWENDESCRVSKETIVESLCYFMERNEMRQSARLCLMGGGDDLEGFEEWVAWERGY